MTRRPVDVSVLRVHVGTHIGFVPPDEWLALTESRVCPGCKAGITSLVMKCANCKKSDELVVAPPIPKAHHLPRPQYNRFEQISLGVTAAALDAGLPPELSVVSDERVDVEVINDVKVVSMHRARILAVAGQTCMKLDVEGECCSCGDTGCEGPVFRETNTVSSCSSMSNCVIDDGTGVSTISHPQVSQVCSKVIPFLVPPPLPSLHETEKKREGGKVEKETSKHVARESVESVHASKYAQQSKYTARESSKQAPQNKHEQDNKHVDDRHTHESDIDSDDEEKGPKKRLRPPHVPGSQALVPPAGSVLSAQMPSGSVERKQVERKQVAQKSGGPRPRGALGHEVKCARSCFVPLMDICTVDTPLLKRIPNAQRSNFATAWGRLLQQQLGRSSLFTQSASCGHQRGEGAVCQEDDNGRLGQGSDGEVGRG